MKLLKFLLSGLAALALVACGGGGGSAGTPILGGGNNTPTATDLVIVLSSPSVANTGQESVTATVTTLDGNRNAVAGVPVTISANNNGIVTPSGTATDGAGKMTAKVEIGSDSSARTITITATSGSITRTAALTVAAPGPVIVASDMVVVLSAGTLANTGNETITATITTLNADRNALANAPISVAVDNNAIVTVSDSRTDASGRATAVVGLGGDRTNRTITLTVRSGTISRAVGIQVTNAIGNIAAADLVLALSSATIASSGTESIVATAIALDANRNAIAGIPVSFTVDSNAVATISGGATDAAGRVSATVGIGADRSLRTINVTARSGNLVRSASLSVVSGPAVPVATDLILVLSASTIANTGSQTVTATATALDSRRNALAGVPVSISVNQSAIATTAATTTNASGVLSSVIGIGADRTKRTITVTATSGNLTQTIPLEVVDGTPVTPVAADVSLVLSSPSLANVATSTLVATVTAVDSNRNVVAGIPVTVRVDGGATAQVSSAVTNASGVVTATIGIGSDRSNRSVTVSATSGTITKTATFRVVGADLSASFAPLVTASTVGNVVEYRLVDGNSLPMAQQQITVSGNGLPSASGLTDLNGKFSFTYNAPSVAGTVTLIAQAAGDSESTLISIQPAGGGAVAPAPQAPIAASLATDPSVVSVNTVGSNANQVELRALFIGANNVAVPRIRVRFDLNGNGSNSDGEVSWLGGNYAYSDAVGVARGTFTPRQRTSPTDGVMVRACFDVVDFTPGTCPNAVVTTLTVVNEPLSVNIRTNEFVKEGAAGLTYIKEFVVMVVDSAGQAKGDVLITPSVDLLAYYKGNYFIGFCGTAPCWVQRLTLAPTEYYRWNAATPAWEPVASTGGTPSCPNEDVNRNAVREAAAFVAGATAPALNARREDLNWNGELDPRKADVAIKMVGSPKTDANGLAIVQIEYGKSVASWVDFLITVTARGVGGSEARARYVGVMDGLGPLPVAASAIFNVTASPAFVISPYGSGTVCTDDK